MIVSASNVTTGSDIDSSTNSTMQQYLTDFWGQPAENSVYLGMFTVHLNSESNATDEWNNQLIAVNYEGIFFGTFINSFYERSYGVSIMRQVYERNLSENNLISFGYRAGLIHGYDERLDSLAQYTPIVPFAQLYAHYQYRMVGVELQYTGVVFSGVFYLNF